MNRVIFVHIPKTAGTSIRRAIPQNIIQTLSHKPSLQQLAGNVKNNSKFLAGHFEYGLHNYLDEECEYITVLRHPIERLFSQYTYTPPRERCGDGSIRDFCHGAFAYAMQNIMTKQLSGLGIDYTGEVTEEHCLSAIENIKTFRFVGFTDDLGKFWNNICSEYGISGKLGWLNASARNKLANVKDSDYSYLSKINSLDMKLYSAAEEMFR